MALQLVIIIMIYKKHFAKFHNSMFYYYKFITRNIRIIKKGDESITFDMEFLETQKLLMKRKKNLLLELFRMMNQGIIDRRLANQD